MKRDRAIFVSLVIGFAIWLCATVLLRFWNVAFFGGTAAAQLLVYAAVTLGIAGLVTILSRVLRSEPVIVAAALAAPGMLLDVAVVHLWHSVFPNLPDEPASFGALMLWCYATAIISGLLLDRYTGS